MRPLSLSLPRWLLVLQLLLSAMLCGLLQAGTARAATTFLDPSAAFAMTARMSDPGTIEVHYQIADGYYMYRERFAFAAAGATLGTPVFPPGKVKFDETFKKDVETYRHAVTIHIPLAQAGGAFTLNATSQGCADAGLCYAPQDARASLSAVAGSGRPTLVSAAPAAATPSAPSSPGTLATLLGGGRLLLIMPAFLVLGLGLAFTPCVLPMVPILSSIIVGEGAGAHRARALLLSIAYSLGMALVYTALGVAAGLIGEGLAAALQNAWVLGAMGLLMVVMALSMFGVYTLQLPAAWQTRLAGASGRQRSGKLAGVFAMGALSALIVGPCVAAPLAGALVYISQTRDVMIGGAALFAMAIGMSIPLLAVGVSAGSLLPRAGAWMDAVKRFFGVLLLAVALWLVSPVLPPAAAMAGWCVLLLAYGVYMLTRGGLWSGKLAGVLFVLLGLVQAVGLATGGRDALAPLAHLSGARSHLAFTRIKTTAQLDAALAKAGGKPALLDFYADWCVSCKEMEKLTFVDPGVQALLADTVRLQVDVTANDADDRAMLKRFGLFGPPGIILFDRQGREIADARVIGYQDAPTFKASLAPLR
ncbi:MAG: protein-disulfide reductase DsbD [Massilia sp.]